MQKYNDQQERVLINSIRLHNALREIDALHVGADYGVHPAVRIEMMDMITNTIKRVGDKAVALSPEGE